MFTYRIHLQGELGQRWEKWFEGFTLTTEPDLTVLTGEIPDQTALHGLLAKIRDLGIPILLVEQIRQTPRQGEPS